MATELAAAQLPVADMVPIRDISQATGVNTVTLRAWERRYGLLVPQRTPKGHRLYTRDDIQKVRDIQVWLGRGVAIGKVKSLLMTVSPEAFSTEIDSVWTSLSAQVYDCINAFQRARLVHLLADTFALYPAEMIADYLLVPLLESLKGNDFGQAAKRAFFTNLLQEYVQAAIYRQRQSAIGEKILLMSLPGDSALPNTTESLLLNYSLLIHQYSAEYLGGLDLKEAQLCAEALQAKIIVLIGYGSLNTSELQLHLKGWREKNAIPIVLAGNLARLYPALGLEADAMIYPCATMQQVHTAINQLVKG